MNEVFVSYSRKDKEFVQKLHTAFTQDNRDIWVDWEDIPLSADWRREIYTGIEGAHSFVFIISPDSVKSEVCAEELEYGIKNHKRLVPVIYRDVKPADVHPELAKLNWIFFRETDDFDSAFRQLIATVDLDLGYVKAHTRLQQRALEWEQKGCDRSFLLRGKDLKQAEDWMGESSDKNPEPTALQSQYIITSSQLQNKRQHLTIIATALVLAFTAGLALFAEGQRQYAVQQRNLAKEQHVKALTTLSEVERLTGNDLDALMSSVEAVEEVIQLRNPSPILAENAQEALQSAVYSVEERNRLEGHLDQVNHISFSPDGQLIASASNDATLKLWQKDGQLLKTLEQCRLCCPWLAADCWGQNWQLWLRLQGLGF